MFCPQLFRLMAEAINLVCYLTLLFQLNKRYFDKLRTGHFGKLRTGHFDRLRTSSSVCLILLFRLNKRSFDKLRTGSSVCFTLLFRLNKRRQLVPALLSTYQKFLLSVLFVLPCLGDKWKVKVLLIFYS